MCSINIKINISSFLYLIISLLDELTHLSHHTSIQFLAIIDYKSLQPSKPFASHIIKLTSSASSSTTTTISILASTSPALQSVGDLIRIVYQIQAFAEAFDKSDIPREAEITALYITNLYSRLQVVATRSR